MPQIQLLTREQHILTLDGTAFTYSVQRSKQRRRTLSLTVTQAGQLTLQVPWRTSYQTIKDFIIRRQAWILQRDQNLRQNQPAITYCDGDELTYMGFKCRLTITQDPSQPSGAQLHHRRFIVNLSDPASGQDFLSSEVKFEMQRWFKRRAMVIFRRRLAVWARRLNVRHGKVSLSHAQRRWGSCSASNDIRLNWHLLALPLPLIDYVVAHELCHVVHKNHSRRFWNLLAQIMPDWPLRRHRLAKSSSFLTR